MGLRYTQELADRAAAWLARPGFSTGADGKRSAEGLLELATIWAAINRTQLPECIRQCQYSERARAVEAYLRDFSRLSTSPTMSESQTTSKYQIAPAFAGQSFVHEDLSAPVTAENLTDELAEFFIKKGRPDAFTKRGTQDKAATEAAGEASESGSVPKADLEAEKTAHAATKTKGNDALKAEKKAHEATRKELTEVSKQLAEATKNLAAAEQQLAGQAGKPHGENTGEADDATK